MLGKESPVGVKRFTSSADVCGDEDIFTQFRVAKSLKDAALR